MGDKNIYIWEKCDIRIFQKYKELYGNQSYNGIIIYQTKSGNSPFEARKDAKLIFYNASVCTMMELTDEEQYACITHEIGHLLDETPLPEGQTTSEEREFNADKKVIELGLQEHLISALRKFNPEAELTAKRIQLLQESIGEQSA